MNHRNAYLKCSSSSLYPRKSEKTSISPNLQPTYVEYLQRTLGNQGFQQYIQPKLKIGKREDKYEKEADRVAELVMRMPEPNALTLAWQTANTRPTQLLWSHREEEPQKKPQIQSQSLDIRRQVDDEPEDEGSFQTKPIGSIEKPVLHRQTEEDVEKEPEEPSDYDEEEESVQTKCNGGAAPKVNRQIERDMHAIRGAGQPLPVSDRAFFEPRFGADFSNVRVHSDSRAAYIARSINAHAFTFGHNVVFGAGRYSPISHSGRKLLAHELTHIVQRTKQNPGTGINIQRFPVTSLAPGGGYSGLLHRGRRRFFLHRVPTIRRSRNIFFIICLVCLPGEQQDIFTDLPGNI